MAVSFSRLLNQIYIYVGHRIITGTNAHILGTMITMIFFAPTMIDIRSRGGNKWELISSLNPIKIVTFDHLLKMAFMLVGRKLQANMDAHL